MPEDLAAQIEPIHEAEFAPWARCSAIEGVEAGRHHRQAGAAGQRAISDTSSSPRATRDLAQLVDPHVTLVNTMSGEVLDVAGVNDKFGVPPERIVDYLMLVGDTVDNVPGVNKVGPKTAVSGWPNMAPSTRWWPPPTASRAWPATICAKPFRTFRSRARC